MIQSSIERLIISHITNYNLLGLYLRLQPFKVVPILPPMQVIGSTFSLPHFVTNCKSSNKKL